MRKLTITVDDKVYEGLKRVIGAGNISRFLSDLARPHVVDKELEAAYAQMAADEQREHDAHEWAEGLIADSFDSTAH